MSLVNNKSPFVPGTATDTAVSSDCNTVVNLSCAFASSFLYIVGSVISVTVSSILSDFQMHLYGDVYIRVIILRPLLCITITWSPNSSSLPSNNLERKRLVFRSLPVANMGKEGMFRVIHF